jgi:hypothetical protein
VVISIAEEVSALIWGSVYAERILNPAQREVRGDAFAKWRKCIVVQDYVVWSSHVAVACNEW